jgi:hypothetical protein
MGQASRGLPGPIHPHPGAHYPAHPHATGATTTQTKTPRITKIEKIEFDATNVGGNQPVPMLIYCNTDDRPFYVCISEDAAKELAVKPKGLFFLE